MEIWLIWLIVAALLIIVELLTMWIATFCIAVGCLAAMAVALLGLSLEWQIGALAIGGVVGFVLFAPFVRRLYDKAGRHRSVESLSNMDALIGREVRVIEAIPVDGVGRVKVDGDNWQVRTHAGVAVDVGTKVRIIGYDSIILDVEVI